MMKSDHTVTLRAAGLTLLLAGLQSSDAGAKDLGASFEIVRKGAPIGTHVVHVRHVGDQTVVDTDIGMRVNFGPVPVFHYRHESREVWREGRVQSIDSRTNNNGRKSHLAVRQVTDGLQVDGTGYRGMAPSDAIPSSYWNRSIVSADTLLNTQSGELIDISTKALGRTASPSGSDAEHFRITGTVALDLWYDDARWVGSTFTVRGENLTYRLLPEPPKAPVEARLLE